MGVRIGTDPEVGFGGGFGLGGVLGRDIFAVFASGGIWDGWILGIYHHPIPWAQWMMMLSTGVSPTVTANGAPPQMDLYK